MDKDHHEDLPWFEHLIHVREHYKKQCLDIEKISSEFAKQVLGHLFILNAGGLGSIPALSIFFDFKHISVEDRATLLLVPFIFFCIGAFLSLIGSFAAYINYQAYGEHIDSLMRQEVASRSLAHPASKYSSEFIDLAGRELSDSREQAKRSWHFVRVFLFVSLSSGLLALTMFACGCFYLAYSGLHGAS